MMLKYNLLFALIYCLIGFQLFAQKQPNIKETTETSARLHIILDSVYNRYPETKGIGICIMFAQKKLTWCGAVGKANTKGDSLLVDHPVNIASVTKIYVAATILRLVEQGKLNTETPIQKLLSKQTITLLQGDGYELDKIKVKHLLTNTSGIYDFVNTPLFQKRSVENPDYKWTMKEQIELAVDGGSKVFNPSEKFEYSETNYLLLAQIIENITQKPFYEVLKQELKFEALNLHHTWFLHQEEKPKQSLPMAEQTAQKYQVNSLRLNPSFDAFGGGGLAATVQDMACFGAGLFEGKIFDHTSTLNLMLTPSMSNENKTFDYCMGLAVTRVQNHVAYGHGGFWGTHLKYIPDLKLSIGVFVLERDTWPVYNILIDAIVKEISLPSK